MMISGTPVQEVVIISEMWRPGNAQGNLNGFRTTRSRDFQWSWHRQLFASALLFLVLALAFRFDAPWLSPVTDSVSYYLKSPRADWTEEIESLARSGIWLDSFERWFPSGKDVINVVAPQVREIGLPVSGSLIQGFGWSMSPENQKVFHGGIDIDVSLGTPVRAADQGKIVEVRVDDQLGRLVLVENAINSTLYAGLGEVLVEVGQQVERGEVIAKVGEGPEGDDIHLHFEVLVNGQQVDPIPLLSSSENAN